MDAFCGTLYREIFKPEDEISTEPLYVTQIPTCDCIFFFLLSLSLYLSPYSFLRKTIFNENLNLKVDEKKKKKIDASSLS